MRKRSIAALIAALFVVAAGVFVSFYLIFTDDSGEAYTITLPGQGSANIDPSPELGESNRAHLQTVTIDRTNIQAVIRSLQRPEVYQLHSQTTYYYNGARSVLRSQLWREGDQVRIDQLSADGTKEKQIFLTKDWVYLWGPDKQVARYVRQNRDADLYSHAPTYEDLLQLPAEAIQDAQIIEVDGHLCIYVVSLDPLTGETEQWYLLVENGLLISAEGQLDGQLTYQTTISDLQLSLEGQDPFVLPDGTKPN